MRRLPALLTVALAADLILTALYLGWSHGVVGKGPPPGEAFDAGVLFFSGFGPDGRLDDEGRSRVGRGAELFTQGRIENLVCLGGRRHAPERSGAQLMAEELLALGVPQSAIRVDRKSFDTVGNWRQGVAILQREGWERPLLISDPLHLARIRSIAAEPFPTRLAPNRSVWERLAAEPLGSWGMVHREWSAWLAMWLLPVDTHRDLVEQWRNFWD